MSVELLLTTGCALGAGFKWVYEYSEKLKWEKNKFLLEQIEKFQSQESTQIVQKCLDWNGFTLNYNGISFKVDDESLIQALKTHNIKHKFNQEEVILRKLFDEYFDNLTKFVILSKSKLISEKNLILFLEYWFDILSGDSKNKDREYIEQLHTYLTYYDYLHLYNFLLKNTQNKQHV